MDLVLNKCFSLKDSYTPPEAQQSYQWIDRYSIEVSIDIILNSNDSLFKNWQKSSYIHKVLVIKDLVIIYLFFSLEN